MAKLELVIDADKDRAFDTQGILGVRLVAELTDGSAEEVIVHQPKGHPDVPLSDAELLEKITWLLESMTPAHTAKRLRDLCGRLSSTDDIEELVDTCRVRSS